MIAGVVYGLLSVRTDVASAAGHDDFLRTLSTGELDADPGYPPAAPRPSCLRMLEDDDGRKIERRDRDVDTHGTQEVCISAQ